MIFLAYEQPGSSLRAPLGWPILTEPFIDFVSARQCSSSLESQIRASTANTSQTPSSDESVLIGDQFMSLRTIVTHTTTMQRPESRKTTQF